MVVEIFLSRGLQMLLQTETKEIQGIIVLLKSKE